ncbi:MAG: hypothetical protein KDJ65_20815 [Anaerolineae bacterium]|nr:hypothetical protein [Anaerolineae bacterium]
MKSLKREIASISDHQWTVLLSLLTLVNMVVLGGLVWLLTVQSSGQFLRVLAQAPATRTPYPTFTPTSTLEPGATALSTLVPTWTPSITYTPEPTNTPESTKTPIYRTPIRATDVPTPTETPTPEFDYIGSVRQLTPCENAGKHHIFAHVRDSAGNGIPGMKMRVSWSGGEANLTTGTKIEDPGLADFAMFKGSYFIEVLDGVSQVMGPITPDIPLNELCDETGNGVANSLFHYSYEVIFTKVR